MKNWQKVLVTIAFLLLISQAGSAQCAMCRATVDSNLSEGRGVIGTGINFGIMYLFVTPYLLVGAMIFLWYRNGKKELAEKIALTNRLKEIYKKD